MTLAARAPVAALLVTIALCLAACGSSTVTPAPSASPSAAAVPSSPSSASEPPASPTASTTGFAFAAEDVLAYYESQGYACDATRPSTVAAGFTVRSCESTDATGRRLVVGVVTDTDGALANGFASVQGTATETILAPIDALDPLAGFLGAMLGEESGVAQLTWLASHLGDAYAETTVGPITLATYTASVDDHSTLYVEVANEAYLEASTVPGASPSPS